jgi:hypothetical protein
MNQPLTPKAAQPQIQAALRERADEIDCGQTALNAQRAIGCLTPST